MKIRDKLEREELLLPVNPWFILLSMIIGLLINFVPLGKIVWRPDILAVIIMFWSIQQPGKVRFAVAFMLGLIMDVHYGVLLGQFALSYVFICFIGALVSSRVLWFDLKGQMLHVLPVFIFFHLLIVGVHWIKGDVGLSLTVMIAPLIEMALWPIADFLLLAPQRQTTSEAVH